MSSQFHGQGVMQNASGPFIGQGGDQSNTATVNIGGPASAQGPYVSQQQQQASAFMPPANGQPPPWAYPNQQPPSVPAASNLPPPPSPTEQCLVQTQITDYMRRPQQPLMGCPDTAVGPKPPHLSGFVWFERHAFNDCNGGPSNSCLYCGKHLDYYRLCPGAMGMNPNVQINNDKEKFPTYDGFDHWLHTCHSILKQKENGKKYSKVLAAGKCQNSGCVFDYWEARNEPCPRNPHPALPRGTRRGNNNNAGGGAAAFQ